MVDRRTSTRVTGSIEEDSDETYWAGGLLICEIERRHDATYDVTTGKRSATTGMTTTLGLKER